MSESSAFERAPEPKKAIEPRNVPELEHVTEGPEIKRAPLPVVEEALREIKRKQGPPRQPPYDPHKPFEIIQNDEESPPSEPTMH